MTKTHALARGYFGLFQHRRTLCHAYGDVKKRTLHGARTGARYLLSQNNPTCKVCKMALIPTIKNTPQKAFEKAVKGILKQGAYGVTSSGVCLYYSKDTGNKCIAGQLFTDAKAKAIENKHGPTNAQKVLSVEGFHHTVQTLMQELQVVHDRLARAGAYNRATFIKAMRDFADARDLNTDFIPTK